VCTGGTNIPNLLKNTNKTDVNIIMEIASRTISEDRRFSKRKRWGDSFVYFVTYLMDFDEYKREEAIVTAADERDSISKLP